jgi:FAD dependent oxidoreductase TIGR03364
MDKKAIVTGAGIAGLAAARALAMQGYHVTVIERTHKAVGASIRNFGMVWPVGQPDGVLYERAMLSRSIWKEVCDEAGIWYEETGSLHLAYAQDEWAVINEYAEKVIPERQCSLLSPEETIKRSDAVVGDNLLGALWSPHEMIVDPREAIAAIPGWLESKFGVEFVWGTAVTSIQYPAVYAGKKQFMADEIFICSGADFETLYPEIFAAAPLTKCKLQMMRMAPQPENWRIGPSLCGGLSLTHYKGFSAAPSLAVLKKRFNEEYPEYIKWGIHVMVSQNGYGEITAGDSHEYGLTHDPFDRQYINNLVLDYLRGFARFRNETIIETWNGIYPKLTNGEEHFIVSPEEGVTLINGLGGAGMTLSFGLCDQYIRGLSV